MNLCVKTVRTVEVLGKEEQYKAYNDSVVKDRPYTLYTWVHQEEFLTALLPMSNTQEQEQAGRTHR